MKRRWIELSDSIDVLEKRTLDFLKMPNFDEEPWIAHAAKKGTSYAEVNSSQSAWLFRVKQLASAVSVTKFSNRALENVLRELETLTIAPEEVRRVPEILANCGVRFVVVERLPQAKIDGACCWLDNGSPIVGMSLRRDTIDNFWFVLRHEIEHVLRGDGKKQEIIDDEEGATPEPMTHCHLKNVQPTLRQWSSVRLGWLHLWPANIVHYERDVLAFAKTVNRHPGIVIGQMQFLMNNYAYLTRHLTKIRSFLLPASIFDGWGQVPAI